MWNVRARVSSEAAVGLVGELLREVGLAAVADQGGAWRVGDLYLVRDDGKVDPRVGAYLRSRHWRNFAASSRERYVRSLAVWFTFLDTLPKSWSSATDDDLDAFKEWRITSQDNARRVEGASFNVDLAAIADFHDWAMKKFGVPTPVVRDSRASSRRGGARNGPSGSASAPAARPRAVRDRNVKWLEPRAVSRWISLALMGLDLDGAETMKVRNGARDAAYAMTLFGSGLRRTEGASLLTLELERLLDAPQMYTSHALAAACAKGGEARRWWLPRDARSGLLNYVQIDRTEAVERAQRAGRYARAPHVVEAVSARGVATISSGAVTRKAPLGSIGPSERMELFVHGVDGIEPAMLWLNENGMPRPASAWSKTFDVGNERVNKLGLQWFSCTPHMLRHSFAFRWYCVARLLWDRRLDHLTEREARDFRAQFGDTWNFVQMLLGHKSPETTRNIYLEPFKVLEVEMLMEVASGVPLSGLMERLIDVDPRILTVGSL